MFLQIPSPHPLPQRLPTFMGKVRAPNKKIAPGPRISLGSPVNMAYCKYGLFSLLVRSKHYNTKSKLQNVICNYLPV
jgi:hypothetical protein